jgi:hypothetical protein
MAKFWYSFKSIFLNNLLFPDKDYETSPHKIIIKYLISLEAMIFYKLRSPHINTTCLTMAFKSLKIFNFQKSFLS